MDAINNIPILSCVRPDATFYCFIDISKTGLDSEQFAYALLEKAHVAVVPGLAYGQSYSNYIRIAFTLRPNLLVEAFNRIAFFCEKEA